jgi:hypothetical protein
MEAQGSRACAGEGRERERKGEKGREREETLSPARCLNADALLAAQVGRYYGESSNEAWNLAARAPQERILLLQIK